MNSLTPIPKEWINPILTGNVQADLIRMGAATAQVEVHYRLPLTPRLPPPHGRIALDVPTGARLSEARLVSERSARERKGALYLGFTVPKVKAGTSPVVVVIWAMGHPLEYEPGMTWKLVGQFHWSGTSYRVYSEDRA